MVNIHLEPLGGGISIYVSKEFVFGTDAVLLADFARPAPHNIACDLGTGCGIIPLLWMRERSPRTAVGVEIQKEAFELLDRSIEYNNIEERLSFVQGDLREIEKVLKCDGYDLVTCNPPYKQEGAGEVADKPQRSQARHELTCTITDAVHAANKLLKYGGRFCVCQRPERLCDVICAMRNEKIEPKRIRFVQQRTSTAPWLVLVEGKKGARSGIICEKTLLIESPDGEYSEEMRRIYKLYREAQR